MAPILTSGYVRERTYRTELKKAGLKVDEEEHVAHIIAAENGGPNHTDNYHFVQSGSFNTSISSFHDEINCYIAGLARTRRAVRVALEVSQDWTLCGHLRYENRLFHDSNLFEKVSAGLSRRSYLRGKAPPDYGGYPSAPYTEGEIDLIARRLFKRGETMWKQGFRAFIQLTTMRREKKLRPGQALPTLGPKEVADKYEIMGNMVDIDYPSSRGRVKELRVKVHEVSWYRVPLKEVQKLAMDRGSADTGDHRSTVPKLAIDAEQLPVEKWQSKEATLRLDKVPAVIEAGCAVGSKRGFHPGKAPVESRSEVRKLRNSIRRKVDERLQSKDQNLPTGISGAAKFTPFQQAEVKPDGEDEDVIFNTNCKIYRFILEKNEWKECGVGKSSVMQLVDQKRCRYLMREKTGKILANHLIMPGTKIQQHGSNNKALIFNCVDSTDNEMTTELFCVRFAKAEHAQQFKNAYEDGRNMNEHQTSLETPAGGRFGALQAGGFGQQPQTSTLCGETAGGLGSPTTTMQSGSASFNISSQLQAQPALELTTTTMTGFGSGGGDFGQPAVGTWTAQGTSHTAWQKTQGMDDSSPGAITTVYFDSITCMSGYATKSVEELRWEDYDAWIKESHLAGIAGQTGGMPGSQVATSTSFGGATQLPTTSALGASAHMSSFEALSPSSFGGFRKFGYAAPTPTLGDCSSPAFGPAPEATSGGESSSFHQPQTWNDFESTSPTTNGFVDSERLETVHPKEPWLVEKATRPPEIETPPMGSYPLKYRPVSPIGAELPAQEPYTPDEPLCQTPRTSTPHVCGKHSAGVKLYPTTNDDYDGGPRRCKAMTSKGTQCKTGRKFLDTVQGMVRGVVRLALPKGTPLCGIHQRVKPANLELYPSTNSDYDDDPGTCKAMIKNGANEGKQCSKPKKI